MGQALGVSDAAYGYMAKQREIQMSVNMAQARDMTQYVAGVWCGLATVGALGTMRLGAFPKPLAIPLCVLPIVGGYQADMAYGTKLRRVTLEAQHIMDAERYRFVPPKQAPFASVYEEENEALQATALAKTGRVGSYWPSFAREWLEAKPRPEPTSEKHNK